LPAFVPFARCQPEERSAPRQPGEREGDRLPPLPPLQSRRTFGGSRERGPGGEGVPDYRGQRRRALVRGTRGGDRPQPEPFSSHRSTAEVAPTRRSDSRLGRRRSVRSSSPRVRRASPRFCSETMPRGSFAISRIAFRRRVSSAPTATTKASLRALWVSSRRRGSV
jgi:hypothetical protein